MRIARPSDRSRPARTFALAASCFASCTASALADVKLPALFSDHMVMQANEPFTMWGTADPREKITVSASWTTDAHHVEADAAGHWQVKLAAPKPGGPYTLRVAGKNDVALSDVLAGEVWLCGGQSNMEMPVGNGSPERSVLDVEAVLAHANHPDIRYFNVPNTTAIEPSSDCEARWTKCDAAALNWCSAAAYFFALELSRELDVPIGLIESDAGGAPIEAWMSADALARWPDFTTALNDVKRDAIELSKPGRFDAAFAEWYRSLDALDVGRGAGASRSAWSDPSFDDSAWPEIDVPATWSGDLESFDGFVWCRRTFELASEWAGRAAVLELGPIDDMDSTFVNGVKVGETVGIGVSEKPRSYALGIGTLRAGRNVVAVRVLDTGGAGGIHGKDARFGVRAENGGEFVALAGKWRAHVANKMSALPLSPRATWRDPSQPALLYNGMIAPLVPYRLRGAIWYQGEGNWKDAHRYRELFPAMIADWRKHFAQGDFPFYFVQIAPFAYEQDTGQAAELREAQTMTLAVPNTAMAVTMDVGDPANIHPRNKQAVGERLARIALAKTYGRKDLEWSGPMFASMNVERGSIRLRFDHARGLTSHEKPLAHFTIASSDRKFVPATAAIDGETVLVSSDAVKEPVAVRYCWGAADAGTLFNAAGLPAPSFRTDDWRGVTETDR